MADQSLPKPIDYTMPDNKISLGKVSPLNGSTIGVEILGMFQWIKGDASDNSRCLARMDERLALMEGGLSLMRQRLDTMASTFRQLQGYIESINNELYDLRKRQTPLQRFWCWLCRPWRKT